jgi:hypothetical protein
VFQHLVAQHRVKYLISDRQRHSVAIDICKIIGWQVKPNVTFNVVKYVAIGQTATSQIQEPAFGKIGALLK